MKRPTRGTLKPPQVERQAYSVTEAGLALGVHRNSVSRLIKCGLLRKVRLAGGGIRIPAAAIDEYLAGGKAS
jgi:excisionase family DNA binding protein